MHEIKPVRKIRIPCYPHKEYALSHLELLDKLPERWQRSRQAVTAAGLLAAIAMATSGCGSLEPSASSIAVTPLTPQTSIVPTPLAADTFMYLGEPTPPPLIGEAEALAKIERIAIEYLPGLSSKYKVDNIAEPVLYVLDSNKRNEYEEAEAVEDEGCIDLYDPSIGVGIEFIGQEDKWEGHTNAKSIVPDNDNAYVLVINELYVGQDEVEIRKQIEDFLIWLKAEGIV